MMMTSAGKKASSEASEGGESPASEQPVVLADGPGAKDPNVPHSYTIISGKMVSDQIKAELTEEVANMKKEHGVVPGLAVIIVGGREDSKSYVRNKKRAATKIGFHTVDVELPDDITEEALIAEVQKLNDDPKIHGILVQLPLPKHINENKVLKTISVEKDADGFHATNVGNLWLSGGDPPLAIACTPAGCHELLERYNIPISGKTCVVLGRSNIVGMPMCCLLQSSNGTVTCCHSRTANTKELVQKADIVIVAIGKVNYVRGDWIKQGAVVIDVGIHVVGTTASGKRKMAGDVCFEEVAPKCSYITPVPNGVGPMTIAMLMKNTVNLARHALGLERLRLRKSPSHVNVDGSSKTVQTN